MEMEAQMEIKKQDDGVERKSILESKTFFSF